MPKADPKFAVSDFRKTAQKLIAEGKMPPLSQVLAAVNSVKTEFGSKIADAQKQPADDGRAPEPGEDLETT